MQENKNEVHIWTIGEYRKDENSDTYLLVMNLID